MEEENSSAPESQPFSTPQRESDVGILLYFLYDLYKQIRLFLFLIIFLFLGINKWVNSFAYSVSVGLSLLLLYFILLIVYSYKKYLNKVFYIDYPNQEFRIEEGVFKKKSLNFQMDRIQQINLKQNWIQRILRLSSLELDMAGSKGKEVSLKALSIDTAHSLMDTLRSARNGMASKAVPAADSEPVLADDEQMRMVPNKVLKTPLLKLLAYGISINPLEGILFIFIPVQYFYANLSSFFERQVAEVEHYFYTAPWKYYLFFAFSLLIAAFLLNIARTILRFYGQTLDLSQDGLRIKQGLFNIRTLSLRPLRIQLIRIHQNYLQSRMKLLNFKILQFGDLEGKDATTRIVALPVEKSHDINSFLGLEDLGEVKEIIRPNHKYYWFLNGIYVGLLTLVAIPFFLNYQDKFWLVLIPFLVLAVVLLVWNYQLYKQYRLVLYESHIVKHFGFWNKRQIVLNIFKIQTITLKQYFYQKKSQRGKITFTTAGGSFNFRLCDFPKLLAIRDTYLQQMEAHPRKWM